MDGFVGHCVENAGPTISARADKVTVPQNGRRTWRDFNSRRVISWPLDGHQRQAILRRSCPVAREQLARSDEEKEPVSIPGRETRRGCGVVIHVAEALCSVDEVGQDKRL